MKQEEEWKTRLDEKENEKTRRGGERKEEKSTQNERRQRKGAVVRSLKTATVSKFELAPLENGK